MDSAEDLTRASRLAYTKRMRTEVTTLACEHARQHPDKPLLIEDIEAQLAHVVPDWNAAQSIIERDKRTLIYETLGAIDWDDVYGSGKDEHPGRVLEFVDKGVVIHRWFADALQLQGRMGWLEKMERGLYLHRQRLALSEQELAQHPERSAQENGAEADQKATAFLRQQGVS